MIENASDSDMGSYECMAKSPAGEVKSRSVHMKTTNNNNSTKGSYKHVYSNLTRVIFIWPCFLFVDGRTRYAVKPKFIVTPEDVDAQDGSSARLNCEVVGHPRPVITWTFNDGPVDRQRTGVFVSLHFKVYFHLFFVLQWI